MGRTFVLATLTAGFLSLVPAVVTAQKKTKDAAETATAKDYKNLQSTKEMTGKMMGLTLNTLTFRLDTPHMVPNPKYKPSAATAQNQQMQTINRLQTQVVAAPTPAKQQIAMQKLMAAMQKSDYQQAMANSNPNNQPYMMAHQYKDYDLDLSEKVIVRKMVLEKVYDDKGNLKTYTSAEKDKLRGNDSSLPGYKATVDDLQQTGLQVKVHLKMPKKTKLADTKKTDDKTTADKATDDKAATDKAGDDKAAAKPKADPADQVTDSARKTDKAKEEVVKPIITMVIILEALDTPTTADATPAKKKSDN